MTVGRGHDAVWPAVQGLGGRVVSPAGPHNPPHSPLPEASAAEAPPFSRVQERSFFIRMKSTLTKRGLHVKASGYKVRVGSLAPAPGARVPSPTWGELPHASQPWPRARAPVGDGPPSSNPACRLQVIHVTGRLRARSLGLVALGHTLPPAPLAELPLHGHMIVFRLSLGLTILACESRYRGWGPRRAAGATRESWGAGEPRGRKSGGGTGRRGRGGACGRGVVVLGAGLAGAPCCRAPPLPTPSASRLSSPLSPAPCSGEIK